MAEQIDGGAGSGALRPTPENPSTYAFAAKETWKLVESDKFARGLVTIVRGKMENWEEDIYELPSTRKVGELTQKDVSDVVAWVANSDDFINLNEVNSWLELKLLRAFDTAFTQVGRVGEPLYGNLFGDSARYRIARDKLFDAIRPYVTLNKRHPVWQEINFWANIPAAAGGPPLQEKDEMLARYRFERVEYGSLVFYCPQAYEAVSKQLLQSRNELYDRKILEEIVKIDGQIRQLMGNKLERRKRTHILIPPEEKYSPRGAAIDTRVILRAGEHIYRNAAHELVHSQLAQLYGYSSSASAAEGAAMYFAKKVHPRDPLNDYATFPIGQAEMAHVLQTDPSLGVSHTQLLEKAGARGNLPAGITEYEYAYRFGGFLAEYVATHFGVDAYLAFYQRTCSQNLFDGKTGKQLIKDGVKVAGVGQREINWQALRAMLATVGKGGTTPEQIEQEFTVYMKGRLGGMFP
ncbi:MAG: hypothetical protein HYU80_04220 [Candidatus Blackburnbacteria bacterium]|nr:hypothetical protein [Candidatus Blackburnbacteria bacterium]